MSGRAWDAAGYDRVGTPMTDMARAVLDRARLSADETVLDAGCGTGRVTELILERVPRGRVVAVDADADMVALARRNLGGRVHVIHADLLTVDVDVPVDVVVSTATFHWVLDHRELFRNLYRLLVPGGRLVAQCGGAGNIASLREAGDRVAARPPYREHFEGWTAPWYYAEPETTAQRLAEVGFTDVRTWLEAWPVEPEDPSAYLATVTLGAQVQRLPGALRDSYVGDVLGLLDDPSRVDYVRLNIDAVRPL